MLLRFTSLNVSFGGTSILIVVGVALETVQQLESLLAMRHYKNFPVNQGKQIYDRIAAGGRIRRQRERLGISRQEIAEKIGRVEKYYADIERGYCGMSLDTMVDIAGCLGITLDYIIFGEEDKQKLSSESAAILFYLESCDENKRKKAVELLKIYLSD